MEPLINPPPFIWVTNVDTSEPVGVRVDQILLIEQKRPEDGGAVAIYLAHGKELHVIESFRAVRAMVEGAERRELAAVGVA